MWARGCQKDTCNNSGCMQPLLPSLGREESSSQEVWERKIALPGVEAWKRPIRTDSQLCDFATSVRRKVEEKNEKRWKNSHGGCTYFCSCFKLWLVDLKSAIFQCNAMKRRNLEISIYAEVSWRGQRVASPGLINKSSLSLRSLSQGWIIFEWLHAPLREKHCLFVLEENFSEKLESH